MMTMRVSFPLIRDDFRRCLAYPAAPHVQSSACLQQRGEAAYSRPVHEVAQSVHGRRSPSAAFGLVAGAPPSSTSPSISFCQQDPIAGDTETPRSVFDRTNVRDGRLQGMSASQASLEEAKGSPSVNGAAHGENTLTHLASTAQPTAQTH